MSCLQPKLNGCLFFSGKIIAMIIRKIFVSVFLIGSLAAINTAQTSGIPDPKTLEAIEAFHKCTAKYGSFCRGYASRSGVQARHAPRKDAPTIKGGHVYDHGEMILLLEPRPIPERSGWIRVEALVDGERAVTGWLPRTDLVLEADLRQVIGCWPVSSINWHQEEAGEVPETDIRLRFTPEGQVFELGVGDEPVPTSHAIYYAKGIFRIRDQSEYSFDYDVIGLLFPEKHRIELHLDLGEFLDPPYTMFDREKLSGCKVIPVLKQEASSITKKK